MGANCCRVISEQSLKGKKEGNSLESNSGERVSSVKCHVKGLGGPSGGSGTLAREREPPKPEKWELKMSLEE